MKGGTRQSRSGPETWNDNKEGFEKRGTRQSAGKAASLLRRDTELSLSLGLQNSGQSSLP